MKHFLTLLIVWQFSTLCTAQNILNPQPAHVDDAFHLMWLSNEQIKNNDIQNEQIVDLVNVHLTDSILKKKTQYHRAFAAGWVLNSVGINWWSVYQTKQKFVGTAYHGIAISDREIFTEYDLNIDLFAHLPQYYEKSATCYAAMKQKDRRIPDSEYEKPAFAPPSAANLNHLRMHCEHTPDKLCREVMNRLFFPTEGEYSFKNHPNFMDEFPTIGVYGPMVLDCNHHCHPELHPYEYIWWLNTTNERKENQVLWHVGLMKEGSNRFKAWSTSPRTGVVSIPFCLPFQTDSANLCLESILTDGGFNASSLNELKGLPDNTFRFHLKPDVFIIPVEKREIKLSVNVSKAVPQQGICYWINRVQIDKEQALISGYLNIAQSVNRLHQFNVRLSKF